MPELRAMLQSTDLPTDSKRFRCAKTDPIFCTTVSGQRAINKAARVGDSNHGDSNHADTFDGIAIS
jgi:hypothetical protein